MHNISSPLPDADFSALKNEDMALGLHDEHSEGTLVEGYNSDIGISTNDGSTKDELNDCILKNVPSPRIRCKERFHFQPKGERGNCLPGGSILPYERQSLSEIRMRVPEMTELNSPMKIDDNFKLCQASQFRKKQSLNRQVSNSSMTISRGSFPDLYYNPDLYMSENGSKLSMAHNQPISEVVNSSKQLISPTTERDLLLFRRRSYDKEDSRLSPHANQSNLNACSNSNNCSLNLTKSTPSLELDSNQCVDFTVEVLNRKLKSFERGNLPKIPHEFLTEFPQNLPRRENTKMQLDGMWERSSRNLSSDDENETANAQFCKKPNHQQIVAIIEFLQTETTYLKILEKIIDLHVAVYLNLSLSISSPLSPNIHRSSTPRLPQSIFSKENHEDLLALVGLSAKIKTSKRSRIQGKVNSIKSCKTLPEKKIGCSSECASVSQSSKLNNRDRSMSIPSTVFLFDQLSSNNLPSFTPSTTEANGSSGGEQFSWRFESVNDIFGNIGQVYAASNTFWEICFEPCLNGFPNIDARNSIRLIRKAFLKFDTIFEPYISYIENCQTIIANIKYLERVSPLFERYHDWTLTHSELRCRETLIDLLNKPFQRITRYGILLGRIREFTIDEYEISDLDDVIAIVDSFVKKIDGIQPLQNSRKKLEQFLDRIDKYTFLDSIQEELNVQIKHDLMDIKSCIQLPMNIECKDIYRTPIWSVTAKVKYQGGKISEAICVLLTDMILICKQSHKSIKLNIYRPPIRLNCFTIESLADVPGSYMAKKIDEFGLICEVYVFTGKLRDMDYWVTQVKRAQKNLSEFKSLKETLNGPVQITPSELQASFPRFESSQRSSFQTDSSSGWGTARSILNPRNALPWTNYTKQSFGSSSRNTSHQVVQRPTYLFERNGWNTTLTRSPTANSVKSMPTTGIGSMSSMITPNSLTAHAFTTASESGDSEWRTGLSSDSYNSMKEEKETKIEDESVDGLFI